MNKLLLIIDAQNDFLDTGSVPVKGAISIMDKLSDFVKEHGDEFSIKVFTADFHPFNHCSFKDSNSEGAWPRHCVMHSVGAAIYPKLQETVEQTSGDVFYLTKGDVYERADYSLMDNPKSSEKFKNIVEHFNVDVIAVCGIMSEVCVLDTIKGLVKAGYKDKLVVYPNFCPSLDGGKTLTTYLEDEGINYK